VATLRPSPREAAAPGRLPYRPALDGIRGLAVAAVLAYHAGMPWARGGFLGVDAFFVLSGYLITSLLLAEWRSEGGIGLVAFWSRRARRLLPALFLMLAGVGIYAAVIARPEELDRLRGDALATIGYVANWRPVLSGQSYFDQFSIPSPLRHTWSLAIEEQYYAVWPLLVLALIKVRRGSLRLLLPASLAMLAASALLMALLFEPGRDPSRVYYGTDTRAQSLLVGAVLSMVLYRVGPVRGSIPRGILQVAALACVAGLGYAWATTSSDSVVLYRGGFLLLAMGVAVVIVAAVQREGGPVAGALSLPPLRGLGLISYGVYLWHWPVFVLLTPDRLGIDGYGLFFLRIAVTLAIATASYRFVEMPIRRGAFRGRKVSWAFAPATVGLVVVGLVLVTRGGAPAFSLSTVPAAPMPSTAATAPSTVAKGADGPLRVLLVGDSVGLTLGWGFEKEDPALGLSTWNAGGYGCGFLSVDERRDDNGNWVSELENSCKRWRSGWAANVQDFQPDAVVMLFGPWDALDLKVEGNLLEVGTPEWRSYAWGQLRGAVDTLSSRGAKVILLTAPCFKPRDMAMAQTIGGRHLTVWPVEPLNSLYHDFAREHADQASVIELDDFVCPGGEYRDLQIEGVEIRSDGVHFTEEGAAVVARWLAPQIREIVESGD